MGTNVDGGRRSDGLRSVPKLGCAGVGLGPAVEGRGPRIAQEILDRVSRGQTRADLQRERPEPRGAPRMGIRPWRPAEVRYEHTGGRRRRAAVELRHSTEAGPTPQFGGVSRRKGGA